MDQEKSIRRGLCGLAGSSSIHAGLAHYIQTEVELPEMRCGTFNSAMGTCCLGITISVVYSLTPAGAASEPGKAGCDRETVSLLVSPDESWVAFVQEDVCSDGAFVTNVSDIVQLVRRGGEPKREDNVFALDAHGRPENRPLTRWLSSQKLHITVPNKSLIGLQKTRHEGIDIEIKFEPDDSVERQQFLKQFGLAPK
jgi:hypothetical protein